MSLRPRYSLLTLLLLMALVAGGVKLWLGPHHVVEQSKLGEVEFTFRRDWRGNRIVDGPVVHRLFVEGKKPVSIDIRYHRSGVDSNWMFFCVMSQYSLPQFVRESRSCPLSEHELMVFHQVRDTELQRLAAQGIHGEVQMEGEPLGDIFKR